MMTHRFITTAFVVNSSLLMAYSASVFANDSSTTSESSAIHHPTSDISQDCSEATVAEANAELSSFDLIEISCKASAAVLTLVISDAAGREIGIGTGFVASNDGKLVTNYHVIERGANIVAISRDGRSYQVLGVMGIDAKNDLAILKLADSDLPHLELVPDPTVKPGARIAVIGSPLGLHGSLSEGIVSAIRNMGDGNTWLQITAAIAPGSSGSPVLDTNGNVIGIAVSQLASQTTINFAVKSSHAYNLLLSSKFNTKLVPIASLNRRTSDIRQDPDYHTYLSVFINGEFDRALDIIQSLIKRFPNHPVGYRELGDVYWSLQRYTDSITAYRQAVKLNPNYVEAWRELGESHEELRQYSQANNAYREALKLQPENPNLWKNLGQVQMSQGQYFEAVGAFRKAIQLKPTEAVFWSKLGEAHLKLNRHSDATFSLHQAIKLQPDDPVAWFRLGLAYNGTGRYPEEISAYESAVKLRPDFTDAWHNLAVACAKSRQYEKAWSAIRKLETHDARRANTLAEYLSSLSRKAMQTRVGE